MAKEMRLVTEEEYRRLAGLSESSPSKKAKNDDVPYKFNPQVRDDINLQLYSKVLSNMMKSLKNKNDDVRNEKTEKQPQEKAVETSEVKPKRPVNVTNAISQSTIISFPTQSDKNMIYFFADGGRQNALHCLTVFRNVPGLIKWNQEGHISFKGKPYDESTDIQEILEYVFRYTEQEAPLGINRFLEACSIMNFSPSFFTNKIKPLYMRFYGDLNASRLVYDESVFSRFIPL